MLWFFFFSSLHFLNQCYTLFLLCYAALRGNPLHYSWTAAPPLVAFSSSSFFSLSVESHWPPKSKLASPLIPLDLSSRRPSAISICHHKISIFLITTTSSCCLIWGCWLLPGLSRAFPEKAVCLIGLLGAWRDRLDITLRICYMTLFYMLPC